MDQNNRENFPKERPRWKVLRQWMLVVPLITAVIIVLIFLYNGYEVDKRDDIIRKSVDAGYEHIQDDRYKKTGLTTMDHVGYIEFTPAGGLLRRTSDVTVLIRQDANYIDGTDGDLSLVEIYGKEVQWVGERTVIVEPYAIVLTESSSTWGCLGAFLLVVPTFAVVELILTVSCFSAYGKWKIDQTSTRKE